MESKLSLDFDSWRNVFVFLVEEEKKIGERKKRRGGLLNQDCSDVKTYLPLLLGSRFSALSPNLL